MIPCIDKLQLNKFKAVSIPSNADLFSRFGERLSVSDSPDGVQARYNDSKLSGYEEAQKVVDKYLIDELEAFEAQQAELDRLKAIASEKENQTV